ncbi:LPXTG cell wall anchor domain-containing protein, partial [Streptomyces sp. NPDC050848]|uniref:LPXTG cell wall anchor domain-containing protein n=1 Tax=Streptomyces sp. NPDC050848 TaxID=3155791 RepID=UPI0033C8D7B7
GNGENGNAGNGNGGNGNAGNGNGGNGNAGNGNGANGNGGNDGGSENGGNGNGGNGNGGNATGSATGGDDAGTCIVDVDGAECVSNNPDTDNAGSQPVEQGKAKEELAETGAAETSFLIIGAATMIAGGIGFRMLPRLVGGGRAAV